MNDDQVRRTLLLESHRCIDDATERADARIGARGEGPALSDVDPDGVLTYPPNATLSGEEARALRSMKLSPLERSAMRKVIADSCAGAFFRFFNLIDGTGDPEVETPSETWLGAWLVAPQDDADRDMLHDEFLDSRADYERSTARRDPGLELFRFHAGVTQPSAPQAGQSIPSAWGPTPILPRPLQVEQSSAVAGLSGRSSASQG